MAKLTIEALAQIVRDNPASHFVVDSDGWFMNRLDPASNPYDGDSEDDEELNNYDNWDINNIICSSEDVAYHDNGYGSGPNYGGDVLQALAKIVGVKVESV